MPGNIEHLNINESNALLKVIDDTRVLSSCIMRLFLIILSLSIIYSSPSTADSTNEARNVIVKPLIITIGSRMSNKMKPPDSGFAELNVEAGYYPKMIGNTPIGAGEYIGINLGYSQAKSQIYDFKKIGIGISYMGISFGFGRGTIWLYSNEMTNNGQGHYFNSLAFEIEGSMGISGGVGIELSQFDYEGLKQGNGVSAKYYFKLGLSGILLL